MTRLLGISALSHDASVAVIEDDKVLFAAHAERYSRIKNDKMLNTEIIREALTYGEPDVIVFYERPLIKKMRQLYAKQWDVALDLDRIPSMYLARDFPELKGIPIKYVDHHLSHAAAGALTSGYDEAAVVVIDAIGEWDCLTIWKYSAPCEFEKLVSIEYPNSLGLFYTAMTARCDLKPNEDEYILMGMAAYGKPIYKEQMLEDFFYPDELCKMTMNLHRGCRGYLPGADVMDIAASAQAAIETKIFEVMEKAKELTGSDSLVYMGGCALNCVANSQLKQWFDNIWICPNPGDAGSSLGAAAWWNNDTIDWQGPLLGTNIPGNYPVKAAMKELLAGNIVGIANGRAEFGPRALGNRTLSCDPRGDNVKDLMNTIKKRQKFRPFAPAIMEEHAHKYFDMPVERSPYMQFVARCKDPEQFPAIVHEDGTSRVQTVTEAEYPGFYALLKAFYEETGCPMLVNTSLNIKGQPIVNDEKDAADFEAHYGVKVVTKDD